MSKTAPNFISESLALIGTVPVFDSHSEILAGAKFRRKPWFFPYSEDFSTTLGKTIWYARIWPVHLLGVSEILVHEAVHIEQWGRSYSFLARYAQASGRLQLEQEAFRASFLWWIKNGRIPNPKMATNPRILYEYNQYVGGRMKVFYENYRIKGAITWDELMGWATIAVTDLWETFGGL